ncbi:hypothetical protein [Citrifermentans bremense]|uniref:hypothetical protein n=1 Tax=Citrifermentans bremense TaxID=60035 RepID=UPI001CF7C0C6|nr:hypothetical protein [Citrifermentans bremense]
MLAGCGGGGGSTAPTATVAGKVADGYLVDAVVFMDKNGNYTLDAGEPNTVTDANGGYTLTVDPADIGKYPIVALAIAGTTIDMDTKTHVLRSYPLSLPKESVTGTVSSDSNFLSPISTQLRELMESGTSMPDAMAQLRTRLSAGTNIMADYIASQNEPMHTAARNMAALMGAQSNLMFRNYSGTDHLDVTRYRNMMGAMFSNMSTVRNGMPLPQMATNISNIPAGLPYQNTSPFMNGMTWGKSMMGGK